MVLLLSLFADKIEELTFISLSEMKKYIFHERRRNEIKSHIHDKKLNFLLIIYKLKVSCLLLLGNPSFTIDTKFFYTKVLLFIFSINKML